MPEAGKEFSIEVSSPDFKDILFAKDIVPQKVEIIDGEVFVTDSIFYYDGDHYRYGNLKGSFEILFSDPVMIYSNVENGFGIFSAYSRCVYTLATPF